LDGSFHEWLEGRGPRGCLMNLVDDATGTTLCRMGEQETIWAAAGVLTPDREVRRRGGCTRTGKTYTCANPMPRDIAGTSGLSSLEDVRAAGDWHYRGQFAAGWRRRGPQ
jgi:hypothetical protein